MRGTAPGRRRNCGWCAPTHSRASDRPETLRSVLRERSCGSAGEAREGIERAAADLSVAGAFIVAKPMPRFFVQRGQQIEGDVGRLVIARIRARGVAAQRPECGLPRK